MQENKGLYIYYNEEQASLPNSLESSVEIISSQNSHHQVLISAESPRQVIKKKSLEKIPEVVCIDEDILVTILNPYLAMNNTFSAKGSLKIGVLLQEYEKRIEWGPERPKLGLARSEGAEIINEMQSLADITKEDEIVLWVRQVGENGKKKKIVKRSHSQLENEEEDSDVEIIEKRTRPLEESKATASVNKIMVMKSPNRTNGEENKSMAKSSVKIKPKSAKRSNSDIGRSPEKEKEKDELSTNMNESLLIYKDQYQILENINRNFDKLIDYQRMQTKIIKKATPNLHTKLATTPDKPLVIEEDPSE